MNIDEEIQTQKGRQALQEWQLAVQQNPYLIDKDFRHSVNFFLNKASTIDQELTAFAERVIVELDPLVMENNLPHNLPKLESYDAIGQKIEEVIHHPSYEAAGNIIYSSALLERMAKPGGLLEALAFMFLSAQTGEAGHNCPIACSAGIIRVLQKMEDFPQKQFFIEKLITPSYTDNFTGAQFLTEIQGGSDVGNNATMAYQDEEGRWRIQGEKWFCSNADAELILVTARFDKNLPGTKGLGLFLIPSHLESGRHNHFTLRRLKNKIGTCSMATAEIDFQNAFGISVGDPANGFKMVMENVLHISRLFNTFCMLGMARRAYHMALAYAERRVSFREPIISYPLIQENLALIKAENSALLASIFATVHLQDEYDLNPQKDEEKKLLLRLLANLNKYLSAQWSVEHIHHSLDVLAGNGAIESFSAIPRLLRDSIVCENWEGTHNTLRMQTLKDILRHQCDQMYVRYVEQLLAKIDPSLKELDSLQQTLERLKNNLESLKSSTSDLQSLRIKDIVDQMAFLFCGVTLLLEALDQKKSGNFSKMHCLNLFLLKHLEPGAFTINQDYLSLITSIIKPLA